MTAPTNPPRKLSRNAPRTEYPSPNQVPQAPRRRPSEERAEIASSARTAIQLSVLAVVIAGVALGLMVWRTIVSPTGSSGCQATVWRSQPDANRLPESWQIKGDSYELNRRTITIVGPAAESGAVPNILATTSCLGDSAAEAVSRRQASATNAGQTVTAKSDLSDGGFEAVDPDSGAIFLEFRRGEIVVDLAASGGATLSDIETVASAYDLALGGHGGSITSPEPGASGSDAAQSPGASNDTGLTHAAPELEKLLPASIPPNAACAVPDASAAASGTPAPAPCNLSIASDVGSSVLAGGDQDSRAAQAAVTAAGKQLDDLHLAQAAAYNDNGDPVLGISVFSVKGLDGAKVRTIVLDYFGLTGSAVKQSQVTLGGKTWTKFDLGDGGLLYWVRTQGDLVYALTTSDLTLAEQAAAAIP